ncbi:MFS general substrate transporter [Eremomyces bilateralis CBS 781.70]|uniref:MFS general substrate transporter n=1 Tax=Eremomyces bilateralis CBS 781.70 TaxID=1392243 RepID=A0A6G1GEC9_9PEZI|nr:MFS general substrate transporter [Eremomyces bilateralis CBS 781.70]KAF1816266.1 MFS general substrate transporter [Eremomyces bilateralis CBS 781.70]
MSTNKIAQILASRSKLKAGNNRTNAGNITGFAYGLFDTLNKHFQDTLHITKGRSAGLQGVYFGAYPLASLGLVLYGIGALCMWPAGLYQSFGGFCGATLVIGSGLGTLETAANPFMAVCGPPKYSELRINLAQAVQAVGTVVGPVLGSYVFFKETRDSVDALRNVQWVYLAIGIFVFCLAAVFFVSWIPEITDADMQDQAEETHAGSSDKPFHQQYRLFHAAAAQWCYTGAQVAIAGYFINYVVESRPRTGNAMASNFLAIAQGCFAVGRFSGALIMRFIRPRWVLLAYICGVLAFNSASITSEGNAVMLMLTLFFESVCFPTFVALGIRGLGRHTKRGTGHVPPILGAVADARTTPFAMVVPVLFFVVPFSYAICVNFLPAYRDPADKIGESGIRMQTDGGGQRRHNRRVSLGEVVEEGVGGHRSHQPFRRGVIEVL